MSARAMSWAWDQCVGSPVRHLVLLRLAWAADENGYCYLRQKLVARDCGLKKADTVRAHIAELEKTGLVARTAEFRPNGSKRSNSYKLAVPPIDEEAEADPPPQLEGRGVSSQGGALPPGEGGLATLETPDRKSAPRRRNVVWDILVEHFGAPGTENETSDFGRTVSQIRTALSQEFPAIYTGPPEDPAVVAWTKREIDRRVEAMGELQYRTHRRLRNQWAELGRKADIDRTPDTMSGEKPREWERCGCGPNPNCPECGGTDKFGWVS